MTAFRTAFGEELARIVRTPLDLFLLTLFPLILLGTMAAMIFAGSPYPLKTVVVDRDGSALSRQIVSNVAATPQLSVVARTPDLSEALSMVRSEQAVAVLIIPQGVGTRGAGESPVEILYQAVFLSTGALASTYLRVAVEATLLGEAPDIRQIEGVGALRTALPGVQVTILGNPGASLEWYLGLLLGPGVLHLLIAVTCIGSAGLLVQDKSLAGFARSARRPMTELAGRLTPHVLAGTVWGALWMLWLVLARGYHVNGSVLAIVGGMFLLFAATAALGLFLLAVTREVSTSLSGAVIIAGSALAYSGASLPLTGGLWIARAWSDVLPLTHYIALQMDQVLGASAWPALRAAGALLLYPLIAGGAATLLIRRAGRAA
ncbi:MAG TPA: ABC transporter permease [Croceibacterium sp.]|nr:ABC transporter permease [Croceibacterium sp.]